MEPLEMELQTVVSHHVAWKSNPGPLEELASAFNCWAASAALEGVLKEEVQLS